MGRTGMVIVLDLKMIDLLANGRESPKYNLKTFRCTMERAFGIFWLNVRGKSRYEDLAEETRRD